MAAVGTFLASVVGGIAVLALIYGVLRWQIAWLKAGNIAGLAWLTPISSIIYASATAAGVKVHYPSLAYVGLVVGFLAVQALALAIAHSISSKRKVLS